MKPRKVDFEDDILNPIITAALETLKIQCQLDAKNEDPILFSKMTKCQNIDIMSFIKMTGNEYQGGIGLCFPKQTFLKITSCMLKEKFTDITDELKDAACEILNIIFGQAKNKMFENGMTMEKAIPTLVGKNEIQEFQTKMAPYVEIPLKTTAGKLFLLVKKES